MTFYISIIWVSLASLICFFMYSASVINEEAKGGYLSVEDGANDFSTVIEQIQALATEKHDDVYLDNDKNNKILKRLNK